MGRVSIVAKRLREARLRAGISSQRQFGIEAGIDPSGASSRINQYESGKYMPDLLTLTRLAAVVKMPIPYFYCEDDELAEFIVKFSALGPAGKRRLLRLIDEL